MLFEVYFGYTSLFLRLSPFFFISKGLNPGHGIGGLSRPELNAVCSQAIGCLQDLKKKLRGKKKITLHNALFSVNPSISVNSQVDLKRPFHIFMYLA